MAETLVTMVLEVSSFYQNPFELNFSMQTCLCKYCENINLKTYQLRTEMKSKTLSLTGQQSLVVPDYQYFLNTKLRVSEWLAQGLTFYGTVSLYTTVMLTRLYPVLHNVTSRALNVSTDGNSKCKELFQHTCLPYA